MAFMTRPLLLASLLSSLAASPGCYDAHDLSRPDGSVVGELGPTDDASVEIDGNVFVDASQPACRQDFALRSLSIPTLQSGLGFDLDGGGTQAGCGVDGADGIDNALASLVGFAEAANLDINQLLTAAITLRLVRLTVRVDQCGDTPTLVMVDVNGQPLGTPQEAVLVTDSNGGYTFEGSVDEVPIVLSLPFGGGVQVNITLSQVRMDGTVAGSSLSQLVMGGELSGEQISELATTFAAVSGQPPEVIEGILANLLDLYPEPNTGSCTAMSGVLVATGIQL